MSTDVQLTDVQLMFYVGLHPRMTKVWVTSLHSFNTEPPGRDSDNRLPLVTLALAAADYLQIRLLYFIDLHSTSSYFKFVLSFKMCSLLVRSKSCALLPNNKINKPKRSQSANNDSDSTGILNDSEWMYHDLSYVFQLSGCYHDLS